MNRIDTIVSLDFLVKEQRYLIMFLFLLISLPLAISLGVPRPTYASRYSFSNRAVHSVTSSSG